MLANSRHQFILDLLEKQGSVLTSELIKLLNVSPATVRNDLTFLESKRLLKKTYGGALAIESTKFNYTNFHYRETQNNSLKQAIVQVALQHIHDNQSIILDASTTCLKLAQELGHFNRLTVITNGLYTMLALKEQPNITCILIGGITTKGSGSIEGLLGAEMLKTINVDLAFFSGHGFNLQSGLTDFNFYEVELKKEMLKRSEKIIGLLDSTKLGKNSTATFATTDQIDTLITDDQYNQELYEDYQKVITLEKAIVKNKK